MKKVNSRLYSYLFLLIVFSSLLSISVFADYTSTANVHYTFNQSASPYTSDGTETNINISGTGTTNVGKLNGSYTFSTQTITTATGYTQAKIDGSSNWSMMLWFNKTGNNAGGSAFARIGSTTNSGDMRFYLDLEADGRAQAGMTKFGAGGVTVNSILPLTNNAYNWLYMEGSNGNITLYVNNTFQGSTSQSAFQGNFTNGFITIGAISVTFAAAAVDDFRFYNRTLASDERAYIYNSFSGTENVTYINTTGGGGGGGGNSADIIFNSNTDTNNTIKIYPNTLLTINTTATNFNTIPITNHSVYNSTGSLFLRLSNSTTNTTFNIINLIRPGTYYFNASASNLTFTNNTITRTLIITSQANITINNPSNNTLYHYTHNYIEFNTTAIFFNNLTVNITQYLYNSTGSLIRTFSNLTNQVQNNFSNLSIGIYYLNATANDGIVLNQTLTITIVIYNITSGIIIAPITGYNITTRFININWTNVTITPNGIGINLNITNTTIYLLNPSLTINKTISSQIIPFNTITYDFYQENLSVGIYYIGLFQKDVSGANVTSYNLINITHNMLINISAYELITNASIGIFSANITDNLTGESIIGSTSSGSLLLDSIRGRTYLINILGGNYTSPTNLTLTTSNVVIQNYVVYLYKLNTLIVTFYDEITGIIFTSRRAYLELISPIFSGNYTTPINNVTTNITNGTIRIELLDPTNYTARYYANGYQERFFFFSINNNTFTNISLYLLSGSYAQNITIVVTKQDTLPLVGGIVKALKYDILTNSYLLVEICTLDDVGTCVMSLTMNDEYYYFIVEYQGQVIQITVPSYIRRTEVAISVVVGGNILDNFDDYKSITSNLNYEVSTNNTVFFYNSQSNLASQFCVSNYELSIINGSTLINITCSSSSSNTLSVGLSRVVGKNYYAKGIYYESGIPLVLQTLNIPSLERTTASNDKKEDLGIQAGFSILVVIIIGIIGFPEFILFGFSISMVLGNIFGINEFTLGLLIGSCFFTLAIGYMFMKMRNRN